MDANRRLLESGASRLGLDLDGAAVDRLMAYFTELMRWSRRINLIARDTPEAQVVENHFLDSLSLAPLLGDEHVHLLDVGSGAGFPGRAGNYSAIFDTDFSVLQKSRSLSSPISTAIPRKKPRGLKVEKVIAGWPVLRA